MSKTCLLCGETFPDATTFCPRDGSALRATVTGDDLIGELFCERYVVTDLLGEGGMAAVYLARDVRLPQQVAIKVLRDAGLSDPTVVHRFRQEAEAASRINHDRVARVSDFGFMTDGRAFLVMEYVNGRTLRHVLDARGRLPLAEAVAIIGMVAEGLHAAHRLGIVHRDLKPENVMVVEEDDGSVRVKVLDFGIAKLLESPDGEQRTAPGFVIGTPKWMSPEQLLGMPLDARSDVYALALLAFALLTGERAFTGVSEQAEMLSRLSMAPRTLAEACPDVAWPDGVQALFTRTLVREPEGRPATAQEFAREFKRQAELAAPSAHPAETGHATPDDAWVAPASLNTPAPLATPPALPPLPPVIARTPSPVTTISATPEPPGARRPPRVSRGVLAGGGVLTAVAIVAAVFWPRSPSSPSGPAATTDTAATVATAAPATAPTVPPADAAVETPAPDSLAVTTDREPPARDTARATRDSTPPAQRTVPNRTPRTEPRAAPRSSDTPAANDASAALERLITDAEQNIGAGDEGTRRAQATAMIRQLEALTPRLTSESDRGWAAFYLGTSRATLGQREQACTALRRAQSLASASRALRSSTERLLLELSCGD